MTQDLRIKLVIDGLLVSRHNNWHSAERAAAKYDNCHLVDWTGAAVQYKNGKEQSNG